MATFPRREADIVQLARTMIIGISQNPAVFPSCSSMPIQSTLSLYETQKQTEDTAHAAAKIATEAKNDALTGLVDVMMAQRGRAEVDCASDPEKLALIGDAPAPHPKPEPVPGQPRLLEAANQGPGDVTLDWKSPGRAPGFGVVRSYIVQRRDAATGGGPFGPWTLVATVYQHEAVLTDQPRGIQLEYRVIATNIHGESAPSNSVAVVL